MLEVIVPEGNKSFIKLAALHQSYDFGNRILKFYLELLLSPHKIFIWGQYDGVSNR